MRFRFRGVTLIEMVVVIVIIGLLASIAVPTYRNHVLRANRGAARAALLALATAQEKFYLQCNTYTTALNETKDTACSPANLKFPTSSERGYYTLAVTAADASAWTATTIAVSGNAQANDAPCRVFQLTSTGAKTASKSGGAANDLDCWSR